MNDEVFIVPAIKRLVLTNVGCWKHLEANFGPRVNVVTEGSYPVGKTTILQAIKAASLADFSNPYCAPTTGFQYSLIEITPSAEPRTLRNFWEKKVMEQGPQKPISQREKILRILQELASLGEGFCILLDDDILASLDLNDLREALNVIQNFKCQSIIIRAHAKSPSELEEATWFVINSSRDGEPVLNMARNRRSL